MAVAVGSIHGVAARAEHWERHPTGLNNENDCKSHRTPINQSNKQTNKQTSGVGFEKMALLRKADAGETRFILLMSCGSYAESADRARRALGSSSIVPVLTFSAVLLEATRSRPPSTAT